MYIFDTIIKVLLANVISLHSFNAKNDINPRDLIATIYKCDFDNNPRCKGTIQYTPSGDIWSQTNYYTGINSLTILVNSENYKTTITDVSSISKYKAVLYKS